MNSAPVTPDSLGSYANRPGQGSPVAHYDTYANSTLPGKTYRSVSEVPPTSAYWIAYILIIASFISLFMPWLTLKVSAFTCTQKENIKYTELFENSDSDIIDDLKTSEFKDSKLKTMDYCARIMKWGGLAAFIFAGLSVIVGVVSNKHFATMVTLAGLFFIIATAANVVYCFTAKSYINDILGDMSSLLTVKVNTGAGLWISLICSAAASAIACSDMKSRKLMLGSHI